ncbi:membrane protein [Devosia sp. 17-2-E-8]|nr:membrane protein [Devosia sp. 17-2-E-8]CDP53583.1 hypothetical protein [Devosia sp. DBB001]
MAAREVGHRLLWFVGLWLAGVLTVTVIGFIIKLMLRN